MSTRPGRPGYDLEQVLLVAARAVLLDVIRDKDGLKRELRPSRRSSS